MLLFASLLTALGSPPARGAQLAAEVGLQLRATSNVYLDGSREWDLVPRPSLELGVDFARIWSAGYSGEVSVYSRHKDLLSHWHRLFLFANPAWGKRGENELTVELRVDTLRNTSTYAALNNLRPSLLFKLGLEPRSFFRWNFEVETAYRWFYDDQPSNGLDTWVSTSFAFNLPSRTTLIPRVAYGVRYYTNQDTAVTTDVLDQQVIPSLRIGQGLWSKAGLQVDYGYSWAVGPSGVLLRKVTLDQFAYLGEEFLFSGHRASIAFKQLAGERWRFGFVVAYEQRLYDGWPRIDADTGALLPGNRTDHRLMPRGYVDFALVPASGARAAVPDFHLKLEYFYLRQFSNVTWYDADAHGGSLSLALAW